VKNTLHHDLTKLKPLRPEKGKEAAAEKVVQDEKAVGAKKKAGSPEKKRSASGPTGGNPLSQVKPKARARYAEHTTTFTTYVKLAEKVVTRGPNLDMSIDLIEKAEAGILGFVFNDFRNFKSIRLFSDAYPI